MLLQIGSPDTNDRGRHHFDRWWHRRRDHRGRTDDPTTLHDVFVRIGGTVAGTASTSLEVNQDDVLLDHVWLWRADHGVPGTTDWTVNPAETGLVVNGDDVTALGLFVEHYEKTQVLWNGEGGRTVFFECEPPYDPPTQALWMNGTENGYPCYQVADDVRTHDATGIATWTFFRAPPPNVISMHSAIKAPVTPGVQFHNTTAGKILGSGGTEHVFNDSGPGVDSSGPASFIPGLTAIRQVTTGP